VTTLQEEVDALHQELDDQTGSGQAQRKRKTQTEALSKANTYSKRRKIAVNDGAELLVEFEEVTSDCVHPGMHVMIAKLIAHH
jgi:hypothetical protein